MAAEETIVAPATPPGRGGIGIVRLSGPAVPAIAGAMLGSLPAPRHAAVAVFADAEGRAIDAGLALYFPAPHSYTGEEVLELHGHGGPVVMDLLVARALELGARLARPGEFSERAFTNDKLDLAQAEAIADLIDAGSAEAARAALRSLAGEFSREVSELAARLRELRVYVEAAIDFPDEDAEFLAGGEVRARIEEITGRFADIGAAARQGRALRDGLHVVIAGKPNAGKSSLLNVLAGYDAAIVTEIPGTTRDLLRERIHVDGLPIHIVDTAGLREAADVVESEGLRRARNEMNRADLILYVADATLPADPAELDALPRAAAAVIVWNKTDLPDARAPPAHGSHPVVAVSCLTGAGLDALREQLKAAAGYQADAGGTYSARRRHLDALTRAQSLFELAEARLGDRSSVELVAEELRQAHEALGEITGAVSSDALLGSIFSSFCIGK
ncbi:MAG: tRNA uridine-5-carboxymethylaminomethyl(34) synthesis GTPase MnmE [Steroidobacteraceae bacterium]